VDVEDVMRGLNGVMNRVERLAASLGTGCDDCRETPLRMWVDTELADAPQVEACATCGRLVPINIVAISAADARL
jgi:hypothetical protein